MCIYSIILLYYNMYITHYAYELSKNTFYLVFNKRVIDAYYNIIIPIMLRKSVQQIASVNAIRMHHSYICIYILCIGTVALYNMISTNV